MNVDVLAREILDRVFGLLARGAADRKDAFHTPVLATIGLGGEPEARTVVLRKFAPDARALFCHVDLRSPKVREIERDARVSWLFYSAPEKLQLRVKGAATLHTDDQIADEQWRASQLFSRRCYCGDAPGTLKDRPSSGLPADLADRAPTAAETETLGRKNFAVLQSSINEIDVYELNIKGHRRSLFVLNENGEVETKWLTP